MRSRYSAYALGEIDYLADTHAPETADEFDRDDAAAWSKNAKWQRLEILATEGGGPKDDEGVVEFVAHYLQENNALSHHERSTFVRIDGRWYYETGDVLAEPVRKAAKIGRNEPCPCGSGKKFKKCCGAPSLSR